MVAANFERALALVLVHEGGKSDDPHDPGGRTNWGITHTDYDAYRHSKGLPLQDVFLMTEAERNEIYRTQYWDPIRGDDLPSGLDYVVFDGGINSGISQSIKWLQRALPLLPANGRVTQPLVTAVQQVSNMAALIEACCAARLEFLQSLSTFQYFGKGWTTRVKDVQATALAWASGAVPPVSASASPTSQPKALRESAAPLPSTAPGDATVGAGAAAIAAAVAVHGQATPGSTPSPALAPQQAPPSSPAPAPATTTSQPGVPVQAPPAAPGAPPTAAPPKAGPTVTPPAGAPSVQAPAPAAPQAPATAPPAKAPTAAAPPVPAKPTAPAGTPPAVSVPARRPAPLHVPAPAKPAPPSAIAAKPGTAVPPAHPVFGIPSDFVFPAVLVVLALVVLFGLYLSISSRRTRARRLAALGDDPMPKVPLKIASAGAAKAVAPAAVKPASPAPTQTAPAAQAAPASSDLSVPLVKSVYARTLSVLWIICTIVINVIALAELLQGFGFAHENWHQPFVWLSSIYDGYAGQAFGATASVVKEEFGVKLPAWILPVFVLYVSSASAFVVASSGLMRRSTSGEALFAAVIHAGWVFAVPSFVMDAIRYHVVARFARQNTVLFFTYIAAFLVAYVVARFINDDFLSGFAAPHAASMVSAISRGAAAGTFILSSFRGL